MITDTYFTLTEYKRNYNRLRDEFVNAYEDNDEDEFINLQTEWYQRCLETATLDRGFVGDTIGWFPKSLLNGTEVVWKVDDKIREENGEVDRSLAQNLSVSFGKILKFLNNQSNKPKNDFTAARAMLYHYVLQEAKIEPYFPIGGKEKSFEALSVRYGFSKDNLKKKYNTIMASGGRRGYDKEDMKIVHELILTDNPKASSTFEEITKHILF